MFFTRLIRVLCARGWGVGGRRVAFISRCIDYCTVCTMHDYNRFWCIVEHSWRSWTSLQYEDILFVRGEADMSQTPTWMSELPYR